MILSKTRIYSKCYRFSPYSIANLHSLMNLCVYLSTVYIPDDSISDFTRKKYIKSEKSAIFHDDVYQ